jgi:hypothetical protein
VWFTNKLLLLLDVLLLPDNDRPTAAALPGGQRRPCHRMEGSTIVFFNEKV